MPLTIPGPLRRSATGFLVVSTFMAAVPVLAEDFPNRPELGSVIPTDAIRIEVAPGRLDECAPLMAWAFNLPAPSAGFGPFLPEVPVGYGPTCAVIPQTASASYSLSASD